MDGEDADIGRPSIAAGSPDDWRGKDPRMTREPLLSSLKAQQKTSGGDREAIKCVLAEPRACSKAALQPAIKRISQNIISNVEPRVNCIAILKPKENEGKRALNFTSELMVVVFSVAQEGSLFTYFTILG